MATLIGNINSNILVGGIANDFIDAGAGDDIVLGGDGSDSLYGGDGNDIIAGDGGNDYIEGQIGNDSIWGGDGNDSLYGGAGSDRIEGQAGDDLISGQEDNDSIWGGDGNDRIGGDGGNDYIEGQIGSDSIWGGDGNDSLYGGAGSDRIEGQAGDDVISGQEDNDSIWGGDGNDIIGGDGGNDYIEGQTGNDSIWGGDGNDSIWGGAGSDLLSGGLGADTFIWSRGDDSETIIDANALEGDVLQLRGVKAADIGLSVGNGNLIIYIKSTTDQNFDGGIIRVLNVATGGGLRVIIFDDGTKIDLAAGSALYGSGHTAEEYAVLRRKMGEAYDYRGDRGDEAASKLSGIYDAITFDELTSFGPRIGNGTLVGWKLSRLLWIEQGRIIDSLYARYLGGMGLNSKEQRYEAVISNLTAIYFMETGSANSNPNEARSWLTRLSTYQLVDKLVYQNGQRNYAFANGYLILLNKAVQILTGEDYDHNPLESYAANPADYEKAWTLIKTYDLGWWSASQLNQKALDYLNKPISELARLQVVGSTSGKDIFGVAIRVLVQSDNLEDRKKADDIWLKLAEYGSSITQTVLYGDAVFGHNFNAALNTIFSRQSWSRGSMSYPQMYEYLVAHAKEVYYAKIAAGGVGNVDYKSDSQAVPYVNWLIANLMWNGGAGKPFIDQAYYQARAYLARSPLEYSELGSQAGNSNWFWANTIVHLFDVVYCPPSTANSFAKLVDDYTVVPTPSAFKDEWSSYTTYAMEQKYAVYKTAYYFYESEVATQKSDNLWLTVSRLSFQELDDWWQKNKTDIIYAFQDESRLPRVASDATKYITLAVNPELKMDPEMILKLWMQYQGQKSGQLDKANKWVDSAYLYLAKEGNDPSNETVRQAKELLSVLDPIGFANWTQGQELSDLLSRSGAIDIMGVVDEIKQISESETQKFIDDIKTSMNTFANNGLASGEQLDLYQSASVDATLRSMVATLRTVSLAPDLAKATGSAQVSAIFDTLSAKTGLPLQGAITAFVFASVALTARKQALNIGSDAASISRLVGESFYLLGIPYAFKSLMNTTGLTSLGSIVGTGIRNLASISADSFAKTSIGANIAKMSASAAATGQAVISDITQIAARVANNPVLSKLGLVSAMTAAKASVSKLVAKAGGTLFAAGDIAIGIGQVISGARSLDTIAGKVGVAAGTASISAGLMGVAAILTSNPATALFAGAIAVVATIISAIFGIKSASLAQSSHVLYHQGSINEFDF